MKSFSNRVAAITGAGSGIGRALALSLARRGCNLALCDVNPVDLAETAKLAQNHAVKVTTQTVNVAVNEEVLAWAEQVVADHNGVNMIFNNAGVALGGTTEDIELSDYEWIMSINFWGVVHGTKAFLPLLKASGSGHIINTSSIFGIFSQPGMGAYNASKYAVRGFTEALRQELDMAGYGVSVSCVHPGGIKTNIANSARINASLDSITGTDANSAKQHFNDLLLRTTAGQAAEVILNGVLKNKRRILIGTDAYMADWMQRLLPAFYQRLVTTTIRLVAGVASRK